MKHFHLYFYVGLGLFQSPPCRYLQRTLLFLCPMQLHGFDDNCFHWTQIRFLSLRIRPSILWVGLGYNYTESSSSHQCMRIISCHFNNLQQLLLFAATTFYLQQRYLFCRNFFICSMIPVGHCIKERKKKNNHFVINCICDQILSENTCRNINHRNLLLNMHGTDQLPQPLNARLKVVK